VTLNDVDSVVEVRTTLHNNTTGEMTVSSLDVAFLNGSGQQVGSATDVSPLSGDTTEGISITLAPGASASVTAGADTIYLAGSWAPSCQVMQVYSAPGNGN
jgi:hypothetical protein